MQKLYPNFIDKCQDSIYSYLDLSPVLGFVTEISICPLSHGAELYASFCIQKPLLKYRATSADVSRRTVRMSNYNCEHRGNMSGGSGCSIFVEWKLKMHWKHQASLRGGNGSFHVRKQQRIFYLIMRALRFPL